MESGWSLGGFPAAGGHSFLDGLSCQGSGNQGSKLDEKAWSASCLVLVLVQGHDPSLLFWSTRHLIVPVNQPSDISK